MQKFLWILTAVIVCVGGYIASTQLFPDPCSKRGVDKYVQEKLGTMTMVQQQNPVIIRAMKINYLRKHRCFEKLRNERNNE